MNPDVYGNAWQMLWNGYWLYLVARAAHQCMFIFALAASTTALLMALREALDS